MKASRRREQADRELGRTTIGSPSAWLLTLALLVTVVTVPLAEEIGRLGAESPRPLLALAEALPEVAAIGRGEGFFAANRRFQEEIDRAETVLEDESLLRARLLPPVQRALLGVAGLGNEQVYPGRDGWLFYRSDLDHVTGPGFLEPAVLRGRERGGDVWREPPEPDPLPAILELRDLLAKRRVELLVMPTPVKPTVHPSRFTGRSIADARRGVENRSYQELLSRLRASGVAVFDPTALLIGASESPSYLRTDTHWSPAGMELVATELAATLEREVALGAPGRGYFERPASVDNRGDLFGMLRLPAGQRLVAVERVEIRPVLESTGAGWRPAAGAPVLLLGDSFTNVFSDSRLGWGAAAGLAERLSFHLRRPVDRIAVNAGGAHASREALARDLASDQSRLDGTAIVVYQFATRELSFGDWRRIREW
jgi:alginate O-acetyltransferase complex protein AlgJ